MGGLSIVGATSSVLLRALISGWWEYRTSTPTVVPEALPVATGPLVTVSPADCHCPSHVNQSGEGPTPTALDNGGWVYGVVGTLGVP